MNMVKIKALLAKILNCMPIKNGASISAKTGFRIENTNITKIGNYVSGSFKARATAAHSTGWKYCANISVKPSADTFFPCVIYDASGSAAAKYLGNEAVIKANGDIGVYVTADALAANDILYISISYMGV